MHGEEGRPRLSVLLVEDEDLNRRLLRAILARAPDPLLREAELIEAESLAGARQVLAGRRVDLLILDVRLPDGSGLDLARELVGRDRRPKVLILSASVLQTDRDLAAAAGCDAFLGKPYRPAELLDQLQALITPG